MIGLALVASVLASAVVAWGVPDSIVEGAETREIVRIIRRHLNEVKYCYEQELLRQPGLVGKIDVQFTVAASGQVSAAAVEQSTIGNARVESCTVAAVRRWQFAKPFDGGTVRVTYPFILVPREAIKIVAGTNGAGAVEIEAITPTVFIHRSTTFFLARDVAFADPRGFEAFYPGPGHASDNIVLRFPGLVFGGCLVKSMAATDLGFTGDADLDAWPAAIRSVRARYSDPVIVPGHGRRDESGEAYQHTLDLLAAANSPTAPKK